MHLKLPTLRMIDRGIFSPPYRWLPFAIFIYFVSCFLLHPLSPLRTGHLADPDDYMRLNEVINWLQGQGWFDLSHPRLSPGSHTVVHWSRLLDIPLALLMLPFIGLMGAQNAALLASFVVPVALCGLLLWIVSALARPFVGARRANLACLLILFSPLTLFNFAPGRVDHHGYQILVSGFGLVCLERMLSSVNGGRYAIAAAVAFACGLWIGTEALPWLGLFIFCLAVLSAWEGGRLARHAAVFGGSLACATALIWPLAVAPQDYASLAVSWFSGADVILALLSAGVLIGLAFAARYTPRRLPRLVAGAVLGVVSMALFVLVVPQAAGGPFADYDDFDATQALTEISEAQPLIHGISINLHNPLTYAPALVVFLSSVLLPLLALGIIFRCVRDIPARYRFLWWAHGLFLFAALMLTLFWQVRVGWFLQLFMVAPLTMALVQWWGWSNEALRGRPCLWAKVAGFLLLGPIPAVLLPAFYKDAPIVSDVILFPAAREAGQCPLRRSADFLAEPWGLGAHVETIMQSAGTGPELLFRTPHNVIAGNFNVAGNKDDFAFFSTRDESVALDIARKWRVSMVLVCRGAVNLYRDMPHAHMGRDLVLAMDADGKLNLAGNPQHLVFFERLITNHAPTWLKPVPIPGEGNYLLFRVVIPDQP